MADFTAVLVEHGYGTTRHEREIIAAANGELIDASGKPVEEALRLCEQAEAILVRRLDITGALLRRFRRCRILVRYGIGVDNVDLEAATRAGIMVGHVPDYCVDEVSTHAIALLLACVRDVIATHKAMERGGWDLRRVNSVWRMRGRTLGLVGLGRIGRAVARKLAGWGLRMLATDPYVAPEQAEVLGVQLVDLPTLCREADYLSVHVPLLPETRHLIGAPQLASMKPSAILVNTARGPVVDTGALLTALDGGQLARAGLDVFEEEPLPADAPLRRHPRLTLSDHTAWHSEEAQIELQRTAAEEVVRVCTGGLPLALANPEVLHALGRYPEWVPTDTTRWQMKRLAALRARRQEAAP